MIEELLYHNSCLGVRGNVNFYMMTSCLIKVVYCVYRKRG